MLNVFSHRNVTFILLLFRYGQIGRHDDFHDLGHQDHLRAGV